MILVVGATGLLGGEICARLRAAGRPVRGMVRINSDLGRVRRLLEMGVEPVLGDLKDRSSLESACRGVRAVVTTASTTLSRQPDDTIHRTEQLGQQQLIEAAFAAGVEHFVYISISGNIEVESPLWTAKRTVERHLRLSGMAYTILRPSVFMEVWLSPMLGFDYVAGRARILGSGERPISYIALSDVAAFAVASLESPEARNAVLEIGGPEAVSPLEAVTTFEIAMGRPFEREHVPEAVLREHYLTATDPMEKTFAALMLSVAAGDRVEMADALRRFPLRLTRVREYAQRLAGPQRGVKVPQPRAT